MVTNESEIRQELKRLRKYTWSKETRYTPIALGNGPRRSSRGEEEVEEASEYFDEEDVEEDEERKEEEEDVEEDEEMEETRKIRRRKTRRVQLDHALKNASVWVDGGWSTNEAADNSSLKVR